MFQLIYGRAICFSFRIALRGRECKHIFKRELKDPGTVLGEVRCLEANEIKNSWKVDNSQTHQVPLQDLRSLDAKPDLKTYGFTYVTERHIAGPEDVEELSDEYISALEDDSVELVKDL
ncbi:uncharacterized protein MELLADRAFT_113763 [Melampsora larici-populina 98AG31]|uniref:Uncharacterized protein n=1 Tax=Melampsora larici-populina (strain 98AG31 / pathotype 3-4-7) TaxID=747676 RepID=F4SAZ8_MELLP|nr:uncharacterized protein MELLADRAFT_113763 [Melampsora larici-populina 98AG31]EGF98194.1 hypothetical protein MELLADRAFT_113763 [Melampsora larici-populina 98AG31]